MNSKYLHIHPEVQEARNSKKAVVALESTIIAHGMPYPQNVETALAVEQIVRDRGAIPATIAILHGQLKAGLTKEEIHFLGKKGQEVAKTSRRDIPFMVHQKGHGATTVASTMIIADMAGIRIFATGGIGGVHREASTSMDISADLQELAHTDVAVISAGVKSILDIGLTLEYLETHSVPVIGYQTDEFPAFYSRKSGFGVDYRINEVSKIAEVLRAKWDMGLKGGVLIANPIPEQAELEFGFINEAISKALLAADKLGIKGKAITPFLLAKVSELTKGVSLAANIQLVYNNARLAADLAVAAST